MTYGVFDLNVKLIACSVSPLINWPVVNIEQFRYFNLKLCLDVKIKTSYSNLLSPHLKQEVWSVRILNSVLCFVLPILPKAEIEKRSNLFLDLKKTVSTKIFCFTNFHFSIENIESLHPNCSPNARASWIIPLHIFVSPKPTLTANTFLKLCAHKREYRSVIRKCGNASHTSSEENRKTEAR